MFSDTLITNFDLDFHAMIKRLLENYVLYIICYNVILYVVMLYITIADNGWTKWYLVRTLLNHPRVATLL